MTRQLSPAAVSAVQTRRADHRPPDDDLKQIQGVGPAAERRLHQAGILLLAQLAAASPEKIAASAPGLPAKRIAREDWPGQARQLVSARLDVSARRLARSSPQTRSRPRAQYPDKKPVVAPDQQHYATFTVELLLDTTNSVRRIRCIHVQSGDQATWAAWREARLTEFVAEHAGLPLPLEPTPMPRLQSEPAALGGTLGQPAPLADVAIDPAPLPPMVGEVAAVLAGAGEHAEGDEPERQGEGKRIELLILAEGDDRPRQMLPAGAHFSVRVCLDLSDIQEALAAPLECLAKIYARRLGDGARQIIGERRMMIGPAESATVDVWGQQLPAGLYRLEAITRLSLPAMSGPARRDAIASLLGPLLHIY